MPRRGWHFYPDRDDIKRVSRTNGYIIAMASPVLCLLALGRASNLWEAILSLLAFIGSLLAFIGIFICGLWMIRWGRRQHQNEHL